MNEASYKNSRKSLIQYFKWREKRAIPAVNKINEIKSLKGLEVLDVGCGYGSLLSVAINKGANVSGVDIDLDSIKRAKRYLKGKKCQLIKVKDENLPFADNSFDAIFLFDVIEHVKDPKTTIKECYRVLKPKGLLYIEFMPYYCLVGHHLYDKTKLPIHYLPKFLIRRIVPKNLWAQFMSLNRLRIFYLQELLRPTHKIEERFIIKYPDLFELNLPFLKHLGFFGEMFTFSFEGIYQKYD